jgi:hypothetical protein
MSKRTEAIRKKLSRLVAAELKRGTSEDEIVGALEIVKCYTAIAAAQVNASLAKRTINNKN